MQNKDKNTETVLKGYLKYRLETLVSANVLIRF